MMTLRQFEKTPESLPMQTSWYLSDLGESLGRQALFTKQSPQKLKVLRDHALAESAVSSNRIEGVQVDQNRVATLVFGHPKPRNREEEELQGYRKALNLIHSTHIQLPVSEDTILTFHKLIRGKIWDAGQYKDKSVDIIEIGPSGNRKVRFKSVSPDKTPVFLRKSLERWERGLKERCIPSLILLAALNLDFLCIHPFRDGNGRVSRLLLLLALYRLGYEVGYYISIERLIEENKERYYETLKISSHGWHEGKHDPWPYINYLLFILTQAYKEFEGRLGQIKEERGVKTGLVEAAVSALKASFTLADIEKKCHGVSRNMIQLVLARMQNNKKIRCIRRGRSARWERITQ